MQQMAPRIRILQRSGATSARRSSSASLTALIYQTGQSRLKGAKLKRVEEGQQHSVRVWVENVAFDDLLLWLGNLRKQHGIDVDSIVAEHEAGPGLVTVRLTLKQS
jgi:general secretion pathway protein M